MNQKARNFIKNVVYAVGANMSRICTTLILTLLLPRLMTVEDYSFWQLYLFYGTYLIYSSIGWCEGTYLKYGGREFDELDGRRMAAQFLNMSIYEGIVALLVVLFAACFIHDATRSFLLISAALYMWLYILKYQLQTILQATNRISEYAQLYTGERLFYFAMVIIGLVIGQRSFYLIIFAELASNALMLLYGIWVCREIILRIPEPVSASGKETAELIRIGYKLTLAGLASQLIIGIVRFSIERNWGTVVFGKISLSFSMANMMITCITAVSIVLFPMLKRSAPEKISQYYGTLRAVLTIPMFGVLLGYTPMKAILSWWLPQYVDSLKYLAILFPLCIYEVRNSVLVWTYLKVLRKEALIMRANLVMIVVSAALTVLSVAVLGSLDLAVASIVVIYGMKAAYTEWLLGTCIPIFSVKELAVETLLSVVFVVVSWQLPALYAFLIYFAVYAAYVLSRRKEVVNTFFEMKKLLTERN